MKIGVCATDPRQWKAVAENGYDYIEMAFFLIANATDEEFEGMKKAQAEAGIPVEACMGYFPGGFTLYAFDPLTGKGADFSAVETRVREYSEKGFSRATQLGVKVVVIGSGAARRVPDGMERNDAERQFARVLKICGEVASKYGASVVIEPLNKNETDIVNTLEDALKIRAMVNNDNVFVLNDFYHSNLESESLDWIAKAGDLLRHVHICDFERNCPTYEKDADDLIPCVQALKNAGYDARISYECVFKPDFDTAIKNAKSLADAFKAIWA